MRRLLTLVLVAAAVVLVGPADRAQALVTGLVRVIPLTPTNSSPKTLTAVCPAGTRVLSAGADTTPGSGEVVIDRIRPNAALTSVSLHATEDQVGTAAGWFLQAFVVCGAAPTGLELVSATSPATSAAKSVIATCPAGKRVIGTGAELTGGPGQVLLDGIVPNAGLTTVTANAFEDETGLAASWSVTAYAVCAAPVAGLQRVTATSDLSSAGSRVATVACPAGAGLLGVGGSLNGPGGQLVLDASYQADAALTTAGFAAFEDRTGTPADWSVTSFGICAGFAQLTEVVEATSDLPRHPFGGCRSDLHALGVGVGLEGVRGRGGLLHLVSQLLDEDNSQFSVNGVGQPPFPWTFTYQTVCTTPLVNEEFVTVRAVEGSDVSRTATVTCPPGKRVVAPGAWTDMTQDIYLHALRPNASLRSVTVTVAKAKTATSGNWLQNATAVCAPAPAGLQLVTASSVPGSDEYATVTAACPEGKHVVGTGGEVVDGDRQVLLNAIRTDHALGSVTVNAYEDLDGYAGVWTVTAYAICVNR